MRITLAAFGAALLACPALAQSDAAQPKVNQLVIYGDDSCPEGGPDEIIVCARMPEEERFRIPTILRDDPNDPDKQSWSEKATELSYVGRSGIGSCSPTGPGGMIGCREELVRQARADRAGRDSINWNRLIDEARQERLSRIDADAAAVEAEASQAGPDGD